MRVIAGRARSLKLKSPDGVDTRPTTDRIKETLFNILQSELSDCVFMDLFAGSGGIGIEALSRGAKHAYFVENNRDAINCIQDNLIFTKFIDNATLLKQDVFSAIPFVSEKEINIIFMDPPYHADYETELFRLLQKQNYVTANTLIILEADIDKEIDFIEETDFELVREKRYKTNKHLFFRKR